MAKAGLSLPGEALGDFFPGGGVLLPDPGAGTLTPDFSIIVFMRLVIPSSTVIRDILFLLSRVLSLFSIIPSSPPPVGVVPGVGVEGGDSSSSEIAVRVVMT
ncbi:hypothetical protein MAR_007008 [Mya arenaria]|uniref:Uncharacterized protein n=1 Tax=Mya arenaria TaxID=6604 RepID=A0ABY7DA62_MYAAR|nr:hypothetical protein MAR_007008 [Mya arenaria]